MSSLPQSWHQLGSDPNKPSPAATSTAPQPLTRPQKPTLNTGPPRRNHSTSVKSKPTERKKWSSVPGVDPSKIVSRNTKTDQPLVKPKRTMPVSTTTSKLRAKSSANSGSELKSRTPEEINIEIMALRKELSQAKEEGNLLKCRMRKMDEEHTKKVKQLEKNLATAKKEFSENEKKRESSAESVSLLRQKCQKLEQALKDQEQAMRKLQSSSRPARPTELKGLVIAYSPNNNIARKTAAEHKDSSRTSGNAHVPSPAVANELSRLKESVRKLQAENTRFQQQLKERNEEIKLLKQQALRSKASKPSMSGSSSAPSALGRRSMPAAALKTNSNASEAKNNASSSVQQRQSHSTVHRTVRQSSATSTRTVKSAEKVESKTRQISFSTKVASSGRNSSPKVSVQNGSKTVVLNKENVKKVENGPSAKAHPVDSPLPAVNGSRTEEAAKEFDIRVVELQENMAAKKIQRSWRDYQKVARQSEPVPVEKLNIIDAAKIGEMEIEEDVEYLQSVLRGHQERLEYAAMQDDSENPSEADLKQALNTVDAAHKQVWNQHVPQEE